jgi:hypothetical protein
MNPLFLSDKHLRLGAHWQLLVAKLFSCPDGEHCFIREREQWQLLVAQIFSWPDGEHCFIREREQWQLLVAQLFSCPDGEHCFIRERGQWQPFYCGNRKVAAWCGLTHSPGNWTVADKDRTHMFQSVLAHWQLKSCWVAAVKCTNRVSWVIYVAMSIVEDIEKLMLEVERNPLLYNKKLKEYSVRNLKDKLCYEVYESIVTNWSELPAEEKSEKSILIFLFILLVITLIMLTFTRRNFLLNFSTPCI